MSESLVAALVSGLVGVILGGAASNFMAVGPLKKEMAAFGERLASLEATVQTLIAQGGWPRYGRP